MEPQYSDVSAHHVPPTVYPWDISPNVAKMQELLRAHGFSVRVDGDYGWRTEVAVKTFQRQYGLRVDAIVGAETWSKLMATVKPGSRPLRSGCSGADVYELQGLLQVNGYAVKRTGNFGTETKSAVQNFQREHHLRSDGIVDEVTWALLRNRKPPARQSSLFARRLGRK
ncbi:MAG: peptidoglycan-binding protein [Elainella sp. Prado103]|jgi:peptidoglycan hydrolase-like protein with peptidoglycan-binding domain|nr:peptidoglycan-binding protein [Elainella sp. Prado103]